MSVKCLALSLRRLQQQQRCCCLQQARHLMGCQKPTLHVQIITKPQFREALEHLNEHFMPNEPLNLVYGLCGDRDALECLDESHLETLSHGLSVMATPPLSGGDQPRDAAPIAGLCANGRTLCGDLEVGRERYQLRRTPLEKSMHMLHDVSIKLDLFRRFGVHEFFDVRMLSVAPAFQGRGLSRVLIERSEGVARANGFRLMRTDATSDFSQRSFAKLGFQVLAEVSYAELPDFQRVDPAEGSPHQRMQVMVKCI